MGTTESIKHVVVAGGGTAGWLTANILAAQLNQSANNRIKVTVVESPDIPIIGVGEGTVPTMRQTLKLIGVSETDFIRRCNATFKQSIKFVNWQHDPKLAGEHYYHHLFQYPIMPNGNITPIWANTQEQPFTDYVSFQGRLCDSGCGPKKLTHKEFSGPLEYAYHLDAGLFSEFLKEHGTNVNGIELICDTINNVELTEHGEIGSLYLNSGKRVKGDFFIDCTGFRALLLGEALGIPFESKSNYLFVDKAIAVQVPNRNPQNNIASHTIATAHKSGWTWDIELQDRRGVGYVYSSKHQSREDAFETIKRYIGPQHEGLNFRELDMNIGFRSKFWHKNCVAIGLSAGFLEPLEATAILLAEATAKLLVEQFPYHKTLMTSHSEIVNSITKNAWERVIDFIKLHYCITKRRDSKFWLDNVKEESIPSSLQHKLAVWRHRAPVASDFTSKYDVFHLENYLYVLNGMNYVGKYSDAIVNESLKPVVEATYQRITKEATQLVEQLPTHRTLIEQIVKFGMQKI